MDIPRRRVAAAPGLGRGRDTGTGSACTVLQILDVSTAFSGPHLLGVDDVTGDLYAALVADEPESTVLRWKLKAKASKT